ncbi:DNA translocase FtsK [Leptospira interrogans serovar Canicola]|nr:DNA translocase FtsK [Leptospira interrogans serovar Canicola]
MFEEKEKVEQTDSGLENECYEEESVDSEENLSEEETLSSETSTEKDISENFKNFYNFKF